MALGRSILTIIALAVAAPTAANATPTPTALGRTQPGASPTSIDPFTASRPVVYQWPIIGPIIDRFRPPSHRYGPGNRGIEISSTPGSAVTAAGEGRVSFASQVGGDLFVVVVHPDGVRTTYGFLASISVRTGQAVLRGDLVGRSGASVHWGARRGDEYFDPLSLLGAGPPRVRLVRDRSR